MTLRTRIILPLLMLAGRVLADDTDSLDVPLVYRILHYWPNKVAAIIFAAVYFIVGLVISWHVARYRDWWGLCLPIGIMCMAIGYVVRFVEVLSDSLKDSLGVYIFQTFFILCAPATFLAFNYTLYGRVVVRCIGREFSIIRPERVARIFVISDVTTFFLQASGGGLTASRTESMTKIGNDIALVGLVGQGLVCLLPVRRSHRALPLHSGQLRRDPTPRGVVEGHLAAVLLLRPHHYPFRLPYCRIRTGQLRLPHHARGVLLLPRRPPALDCRYVLCRPVAQSVHY
ncbi:hypothetical protein OE88DRAFT_540109 [Heliocybe sulcata]|uniref:RTA1-domain-containing protein n=1 Tax=Heliocybe sulcata TaxID=5364 RepID=A0A5C3MTY7_9AGAM|nr:hypothetical protein OE88DRAFT_540109 [Heliocybe sulcata]